MKKLIQSTLKTLLNQMWLFEDFNDLWDFSNDQIGYTSRVMAYQLWIIQICKLVTKVIKLI